MFCKISRSLAAAVYNFFFFDILIRKNETSQYYLLYFFCQMLCFVGNYRYFLEWNAFCKHASCCEEIDFCSSNTSEQRENLPTLLSHHLLTHSPNGQKYGNKCNLGNPQFAFNANINISFFSILDNLRSNYQIIMQLLIYLYTHYLLQFLAFCAT